MPRLQAELTEEAAWKKRKEESKSAGITTGTDEWCAAWAWPRTPSRLPKAWALLRLASPP